MVKSTTTAYSVEAGIGRMAGTCCFVVVVAVAAVAAVAASGRSSLQNVSRP